MVTKILCLHCGRIQIDHNDGNDDCEYCRGALEGRAWGSSRPRYPLGEHGGYNRDGTVKESVKKELREYFEEQKRRRWNG